MQEAREKIATPPRACGCPASIDYDRELAWKQVAEEFNKRIPRYAEKGIQLEAIQIPKGIGQKPTKEDLTQLLKLAGITGEDAKFTARFI